MISGTPLFSSIDDLNGELHFLGVWPFALPDSVDGSVQNPCIVSSELLLPASLHPGTLSSALNPCIVSSELLLPASLHPGTLSSALTVLYEN